MGPILVRKRVRLVEDECPNFKDDLRVDKKCDKLLNLVEHRCLDHDVPDVDPRSKLLLENLGFRCMDYDVHDDDSDPLYGVDGNSQALVVVPENGASELRRSISSGDGDSQYKLCLEGLRGDGNMKGLEAVQENGVPEVVRSCFPRRIKRRCVSAEDEDPQYKLFVENLREDGDSYALVVDEGNGVSEFKRYHQEGTRRILRRCISDEDVDPQYKLFLDNLREDGNSYAFEVVQENGVSGLIRYHQDNGLGRQVKRRSVCNEELESLKLVDNCEKALSLVKHVNDENEHSGDDNTDIWSVDDSSDGHEFSGDDSDIRSMDDGDNGNEHSSDDGIEFKSVHGDDWNEQASDEHVHVKSSADHVVDPKSKSVSENLREDENIDAEEIVPETEILEHTRYYQKNSLPAEPSLAANARMKKSLVKDKTETENRSTLKNLQDLPKRKSSVLQKNGEMAASGMENGVSSKRPCLEVPNNPEELNADTPEISGSPRMKEKPVMEHRVLKLFQKLREKRSPMVKKNAKLETRNPVSSRTRGHSSGRPHFEVHDTPESFTSSQLKEKMETKKNFRRMKKDKVKNKAATTRSFSKGAMKRKMSCPKNYEDTYSQSNLNEQDCHQDNRYHASFNSQVKTKTPAEDLEDLRPQKSSAALKKRKKNAKEAMNTVCAELDLANESYEAFIGFTEVDGKNFMYTPGNGGRKIYEGVETTSNAETNAMHRDPLDNIHTMDTDGGPVMERRVLKLFQKLREKRSPMVKKNAKLETRNPVSSRTRGHSSGRPHFEVHDTPESFTSSQLKEKMETKKNLRHMKKDKVKSNRLNKSAHLKRPKTLRNERSESLQILEGLQEKKSSRVKKNVKEEAKYPCSVRRNNLANKRPGSEVHQSANYRCDFLSFLEMNDESLAYAPQNGRPEIYDVEIKEENENAESSSDLDVLVLERAPGDGCIPTKKEDNDLKSDTNFRKGLMKDLKRPYDPEEHLNLLTDWSNQRPGKSHAKIFRSGVIKQYALEGEYGKPYSVVYQDLDEMIKESDRPGSLNLLRGFFYWLKNISQEGSFKPWTDAEYSDVVVLL